MEQVGRSITAFDRRGAAIAQIERFSSTMEWRDHEGELHLFRCHGDGRVQRIGPRSEKLLQVQADYETRRAAAEVEIQCSAVELQRCQNLNLSTLANRVPSIVVGVLRALDDMGLADYYRVIGTHALYAYEIAAGVTFDPATTSTNAVDLLWNVNQRMTIAGKMQEAGLSMVELLQSVDPTFERVEDQLESAVNSGGFFVDFLRQAEVQSEPYSISEAEGDIYPVPANRAQRFLNSPPLDQVIIGLDGSMARMRTVDPCVFVEFKRWMAEQPSRDFLKQGRDRRQADAVQQLLAEGRLKSRLEGGADGV